MSKLACFHKIFDHQAISLCICLSEIHISGLERSPESSIEKSPPLACSAVYMGKHKFVNKHIALLGARLGVIVGLIGKHGVMQHEVCNERHLIWYFGNEANFTNVSFKVHGQNIVNRTNRNIL